jgi:hypothetical protein
VKTLSAQEVNKRSIPGEPVAFTDTGELITSEAADEKGQLRLNLLKLTPNSAQLLQTRVLPCYIHASEIYWAEGLYVNCNSEPRNYFYDYPMLVKARATTAESEDSVAASEEKPATEQQTSTRVLKLNPAQGFAEEGSWTFDGYWNMSSLVPGGLALMSEQGGYWMDDIAVTEMSIMPPYYSSACGIYRLVVDKAPELLGKLDNCPGSETVAFTDKQVWTANGFAGIQVKELK